MYDKILIPVDGSEVSNHAVEEGLRLGKELHSKVILLHIVDVSLLSMPEAETGVANFGPIRQSFMDIGKKLLAGFVTKAQEAGVAVETVLAEGDVHDEIIGRAKEKNADLIIMGTHGRRGLNRLILGSVAESVARMAHCAVLLIRPQ